MTMDFKDSPSLRPAHTFKAHYDDQPYHHPFHDSHGPGHRGQQFHHPGSGHLLTSADSAWAWRWALFILPIYYALVNGDKKRVVLDI